MSVDQEPLDFNAARRSGIPMIGMHPLQQASRRISEFRDGRSTLKAKDLVGLLLCHGARAWRASQPVAHSKLRVRTPHGVPAIRLRFR